MKAVLFTKSGSVDGLVLADVPEPAPTANEVMVRVCATTVTRGDVVLRKLPFLLARLLGVDRKSMLGHEYAGEIEAVGPGVTRFSPGDRVFGTTTGLRTGTYAEHIVVPADGILATIPDGVGFEEAAPIPVGALTARSLLGPADVADGRRVLVIGASGSVGSYGVQLAAHTGAHVTGVTSTANLDLVRSLGAERVIDYTREDVVSAEGPPYDVVFDAVGKSSKGRARRLLAPGGAFVTIRSSTKERIEDLLALRDLLAAGAIRAVVDRRYPLEQVREAHAYVEQGHKRGNVLIDVAGRA